MVFRLPATSFYQIIKKRQRIILILLVAVSVSVLLMQKTKLALPRAYKAFKVRPVVIHQKKSWTHPTGEGPLLYAAILKKKPRSKRCSPFSGLWVQPFWSFGDHGYKHTQKYIFTSYSTSPHIQHQIKPWPYSSPQ